MSTSAFAASSDGDSWGKATVGLAQSEPGMGEHASTLDANGDEPGRVGLGNLKNAGLSDTPEGDWCDLMNALDPELYST